MIENDNFIYDLSKKLLEASSRNEENLIQNVVNIIQETTNARMCSLWSINTNNTNGGFLSASLIYRKLENGVIYPFHKNEDYAHDLSECFIKYILDITEESKDIFHISKISECESHRSLKSLIELDLKYILSIPIENDDKEVIALLKLSFCEEIKINDLEIFAITVLKIIFSCLERKILLKKQQLINDLFENYKCKGRKNIKDIFYPIINNIFKKYFFYEGASVFLWNSYDNRYILLTTTGIINENKEVIFYNAGEGLTGKVSKGKKKPKIYDDLIELELSNNPDYKHKYREITFHSGQTMLVLPILRPSNTDDVIGILRFTNKINGQSIRDGNAVVDFFNDTDIEIIECASHYLALNIDYFLGEEDRNNFISKLSHESKTPANAIRVSADRIKKKMGDSTFIRHQFNHYLQSIIDYADFQIMQASTNLYISKFNRNIPKSKKYVVKQIQILSVINESINIIRPFARDRQNIRFDNIVISTLFPRLNLFIDESAFKTVFYNLLTNAIKYVRYDTDFFVEIDGISNNDNIIITVSDYGIGIEENEKEDIFLLGVRSKNVSKFNTEGYGIGLHVVKQIINDFGGEIRVSNCFYPTIFEIKLPIKLINNKFLNSNEWTD